MRTSLRRIPVDEKKARHYSGVKWNLGLSYPGVPAGSPSRGGHVTVSVCHINRPSLPAPFSSVLLSISVFMSLSTVFHSINTLDNSPLSHFVLSVLFLPYWLALM